MKRRYLKVIASFMISLILSLPIYSSFVLAVLSNGYVYGQRDNVIGYFRRYEDVYVNITAWISGDREISTSQVHLCDSHGPTFNSCFDRGDGSFYCGYQTNSYAITQNPCYLRVALYDDKGVFNSMYTLRGGFDEQAPEIRSFSIVPSRINSGNVKFQYDIYEHSYSSTDTNRCTGVKKIELIYQGEIFDTIEINSPSDQCSTTGAISIPISKISNIEEGVVEIVLRAYDNFNQVNSASAQFVYDQEMPIIDKDSLEIKDKNGNSIDYIGGSPINAVISFIVLSEDLELNNVYGDISEINIEHIPSYNNKKATCSVYEEGYRCSFTDVIIKLSQSTTAPITVNVQDTAGNTFSDVLTKINGITYDNTGPSIISIKTDKVDDNINYVGALTSFIVELDEEGIGIDKNNIRLDLSNIKTGLSNKAADECTNSGNQWTCYWRNVSSDKSDGETTIRILDISSDRLGNKVSGTLSANVRIDKTPPAVIPPPQIIARGVGVEAFEGYIKTNDIIDVTLKIKEKNKLRAYADFSSFVTTQDNIAGSCSKEGEDSWTCQWSSDPIDVPGHRIGNLNFEIRDFSGNTIIYKKGIEVLNYENATNVSYWTSGVICSPNLVDRQVTNLVNTRVYCGIELHPIAPDQETLSINLGTCTERFKNSLGYIQNIALVNAGRGGIEPYLAIDLIKGEMTISKIGITCPLRIISRIGKKINKLPEIEQVKVDINFYNMPLGEYGNGIESKIEDAKEDATEGIWKVLGILQKIVSYARLICHGLYIFHKIRLLWETIITPEITLAHLASVGTPLQAKLGAAAAGACVADKTVEKLSKHFYTSLGDRFCKFINCQMSPKAPGSDKGGGGKGTWGNIEKSLGRGDWLGLSSQMDKATTGPLNFLNWPLEGIRKVSEPGAKTASGTFEEVYGKQYYQYANARDNLLVASVIGCLPGVINGLNKYRQIQCLYADCLQQNAYNNVPVKICEDQKAYATCKYIFGEIFAVLPWTAFFDYYIGMIRAALSDPITAVVSVFNVLGNICPPPCAPDPASSKAWIHNEAICRGLQFAALLGEVISNVQGIIDDYKQIKGDYCARIKEDKEEEETK